MFESHLTCLPLFRPRILHICWQIKFLLFQKKFFYFKKFYPKQWHNGNIQMLNFSNDYNAATWQNAHVFCWFWEERIDICEVTKRIEIKFVSWTQFLFGMRWRIEMMDKWTVKRRFETLLVMGRELKCLFKMRAVTVLLCIPQVETLDKTKLNSRFTCYTRILRVKSG